MVVGYLGDSFRLPAWVFYVPSASGLAAQLTDAPAGGLVPGLYACLGSHESRAGNYALVPTLCLKGVCYAERFPSPSG